MTQLATAHYALPLLASGQAQKEITHNEALVLIDALLGGAIESTLLSEPPATLEEGMMWIVGPHATGAWTTQEGRLALWSEGGWRFLQNTIGSLFWDKSRNAFIILRSQGWSMPISLDIPTGGTVIDIEARAAFASVRDMLVTLGLAVP